jgi:hypothetical protein
MKVVNLTGFTVISYSLFSLTHNAVNLLFVEHGKDIRVTVHASPAEGEDCWSNWGVISMGQNTYTTTPACSAIADRTSNQI